MKKALSLALAVLFCATLLVSCGEWPGGYTVKPTATSSAAEPYAEYLASRLGYAPDDAILCVGDGTEYGVDMTDFEDDGYVIKTAGGATLLIGKTGDGLDRAVRAYAKAIEGGYPVADTVYHEGYRIKHLTLGGVDVSEYTVVLTENVNENARFAAGELVRLIKKACGATVEVSESAGEHNIYFAVTDDEAFGTEGFEYSVKDGNVYFTGARARGCAYGVWCFLERELSWKGLIYGDSDLTPADSLDVPDGTYARDTEAFEYLNLYNMAWGSYKNDKGHPTEAQNSYGALANCCHGMQGNEWCGFSVAYEQMCYTSEDNYQACVESISAYIAGRLAAGSVIGLDLKAIDIAQGDNSNFCLCTECRQVFKEEGNHTGAVLRFANRLSEELNETYPGLLYQIFAYAETKEPPKKTVPNGFVHITFCSDLNCSLHRFDGSECSGNMLTAKGRSENRTYAEWLEKWCAVSDNVYLWYYALDAGVSQYTVIDNLYDDFSYFYKLGVCGIFYQCQFYGLGEQRIIHQLVSEFNRSPEMSREEFDAIYADILHREFGDGWELIRDYIADHQASQDRVDCWHCWGWGAKDGTSSGVNGYDMMRYDTEYYAAHFDSYIEMFEKAKSLANSRAEEARIESFSIHVFYKGIYAAYPAALYTHDEARMAELSDRYDYMISLMKKNGFDPAAIVTVDGYLQHVNENLDDEVAEWIRGACGSQYTKFKG